MQAAHLESGRGVPEVPNPTIDAITRAGHVVPSTTHGCGPWQIHFTVHTFLAQALCAITNGGGGGDAHGTGGDATSVTPDEHTANG